MIGSIFPVCYLFSGHFRAEEKNIRKHGWKWVPVAVLAAVLAVWFLHSRRLAAAFDWGMAVTTLTRLRWVWLLVALVPMFGTYYGRALRWEVFLKPLKSRPSMRNLVVATVIGFTAITLFGRAGDFVRPYLIAVKEEVPVSSQIASWFLERVFDLMMASLLMGFALAHVQAEGLHVGPQLGWVLTFGGRIVAIGCTVVLVALFALRQFAEPFRSRALAAAARLPARWTPPCARIIDAATKGFESIRSDGALALIIVYSFLEWFLIGACYWCLAQAYVGMINFTTVDVLITMAFVSFGGVVQIPGVGGGAQVVAVLVLTQILGARLELATSFALVLWIFMFVVVVPVGVWLALREGLSWGSLRRIGRGAVK